MRATDVYLPTFCRSLFSLLTWSSGHVNRARYFTPLDPWNIASCWPLKQPRKLLSLPWHSRFRCCQASHFPCHFIASNALQISAWSPFHTQLQGQHPISKISSSLAKKKKKGNQYALSAANGSTFLATITYLDDTEGGLTLGIAVKRYTCLLHSHRLQRCSVCNSRRTGVASQANGTLLWEDRGSESLDQLFAAQCGEWCHHCGADGGGL